MSDCRLSRSSTNEIFVLILSSAASDDRKLWSVLYVRYRNDKQQKEQVQLPGEHYCGGTRNRLVYNTVL